MRHWWLRQRAKWHPRWYRIADISHVDDTRTLWNCTCGGYAQIRRDGDDLAVIEEATCPQWARAVAAREPLPVARLVLR